MLSFVIAILSLLHPFHVSVTEIKYKEDQKSLQLSSRIFLDDLELALQAYTGRENLDIMDDTSWEFINESLGNYLLENVKLSDSKNKEYTLTYIGAEKEDDVMWCYLEINKVRKIGTVNVTNTVLQEVWDDQENLVHFRVGGKVKSARLLKGEESFQFVWN